MKAGPLLMDFPNTTRYVEKSLALHIGRGDFWAGKFAQLDAIFKTGAGARAFRAFGEKDMTLVIAVSGIGEDYATLYDDQLRNDRIVVLRALAAAKDKTPPEDMGTTPRGRKISRFGVHLVRATVLWALKQHRVEFDQAAEYLTQLERIHYGGKVL